MGQYIKGRKIGTCESMYYMRISEALELARIGACDDDKITFKEYLSDNETKWRFPFPCEDLLEGEQAGGLMDGGDTHKINTAPYDKGFMVPALGVDVGHDTIAVHNTHKGGGYGFNMLIPCPDSKEYAQLIQGGLKESMGRSQGPYLSVRFLAMRDSITPDCVCTAACGAGQGHRVRCIQTVFECARCGHLQRFSPDDVAKIKDQARKHYAMYDTTGKNPGYMGGNQSLHDYAMKVIDRIV